VSEMSPEDFGVDQDTLTVVNAVTEVVDRWR
jgi:hypothetical protein